MNTFRFLILVFFTQIAYAGEFEGNWRFDDPCTTDGHGIHNSITLKKTTSNKYVGSWEESTNDRGWGGQLRGYVQNSKLNLSRCIEPNTSSWSIENSESCPNYKLIGVFILNGNKLLRTSTSSVWPLGESFTKTMKLKDELPNKLYECKVGEE